MEIVSRLRQSARKYGFDFNEAYHRCVFAVDIDPDKINVCSERLACHFPEIKNHERKLFAADFLLSSYPKVDVVVGNPPYIRYEEIPDDKLQQYKAFPTFFYRADMYVLFFEKSLSMLNAGGKHCFICANRWMRNMYGKKLRRLIAEYYAIEKIIDMEHADAFQENVLAYPAITLISNREKLDNLRYADVKAVSGMKSLAYQYLQVPVGDDWSLVFNAQNNGFSLIEEQGFKIGIGVATGADSIFINANLKGLVEDELLLPALNGRDLSGDEFKWGGRYFLNPYDENGNLILLDKYPKAKAYFEQHSERLKSRHKVKMAPLKWYGTIDAVSATLLRKPKILLPDISGNSYVFVDDGEYYPQHNLYYITGTDVRQLMLLAALLMSDFVRSQLNALTNHMNGGYARWQSQYLRKLRVPNITQIPAHLADDLLASYHSRDIVGINRCAEAIVCREQQETKQHISVRKARQLSLMV